MGKNAWKTDTDQGGPPIQCVFTDLVSPPAFVEIDAYRTLTAAKKAENLRLFGKGTPGWKLHVLPKIREARILRSLHDYISPGSPSVIAASGGWEAAGC
ncbi:MAG: hypothetical protein HZA80_02560 [Candidatus Taylorbacteria bacterium]|nr:hypothetical protein [Candidatus Taylorbacteria bacterium]